jgi:hypothetical protein
MSTLSKKPKKIGQEKAKPGLKAGKKKAHKQFKMKGAGKNTSLELGVKLDILETMSTNKWSQGVAAKEFSKRLGVKISQANISWWMDKKEEWMVEVEKNGHTMNMHMIHEVEFPELENAMVKGYELCENQGHQEIYFCP